MTKALSWNVRIYEHRKRIRQQLASWLPANAWKEWYDACPKCDKKALKLGFGPIRCCYSGCKNNLPFVPSLKIKSHSMQPPLYVEGTMLGVRRDDHMFVGAEWLMVNHPDIYAMAFAGLMSNVLRGKGKYWVERF